MPFYNLSKKLLQEKNLSTENITPTRKKGIITKEDILKAAENNKSVESEKATKKMDIKGDSKRVPMSRLRSVVAKRLLESQAQTASLTTFNEVDLFEIKKVKSPTKKSKEPSYIQSVYKVLFADITISFDNVIGVVGAAKGNFSFMIFGLVLSVILTGAMATYLANYIQKHLWIAYIGLGFILLVAIQLVIGGLVDLDILSINEQFKKYF